MTAKNFRWNIDNGIDYVDQLSDTIIDSLIWAWEHIWNLYENTSKVEIQNSINDLLYKLDIADNEDKKKFLSKQLSILVLLKDRYLLEKKEKKKDEKSDSFEINGFDILWNYNPTIRDLVEKNIDFTDSKLDNIWIETSLQKNIINQFTNLYIEYLYKNYRKEDIPKIKKYKFLNLEADELNFILNNINIKEDINVSIKIKKYVSNSDSVLIKPYSVEWLLKKNSVIKNTSTAFHLLNTVEDIKYTKKEYINKKVYNYDKYSNLLKFEWLDVENKKVLIDIINRFYLNKTINIDWKNIKLTKTFLNNNMEWILNNLKTILVIFMWIESWWGKRYLENPTSSAKWILQWIDWYKNWEKNRTFSRKRWNYSPFETALRRTDMYYNGKFTYFNSSKTPDYIKKAWNNWWKLNLKTFSNEKQISLWMIDLVMRWKTAQNLFIKALFWNKIAARSIYDDIHHTQAYWKTFKVAEKHFKANNLEKIV